MSDKPLVGELVKKKRVPPPGWKKGQSGNPGGRPKLPPVHVRDVARLYTTEAVEALRAALNRPGERVQAANILLAYAYGRPSQTHNVRMIRKIDDLSDEELAALAGDDEPLVIEHMAQTERETED